MKSSLLLYVIGAVVLVGGGYLLISNSVGSGDTENGSIAQQAPAESGTFASVMASNKDLECSFEYNDGTNISSGVIFMTKGAKEIRGDFNIQQSGAGAMNASLVRDGGYNYIWGSSFTQGIKTKITAEEEGKLFETKEGPGISEETAFYCEPWSVDSSKFSLPSGVEFMDVSAQVEAATGATGGIKAMQCAACNQLPVGSGREQCLAALSCN